MKFKYFTKQWNFIFVLNRFKELILEMFSAKKSYFPTALSPVRQNLPQGYTFSPWQNHYYFHSRNTLWVARIFSLILNRNKENQRSPKIKIIKYSRLRSFWKPFSFFPHKNADYLCMKSLYCKKYCVPGASVISTIW